MTKLLYFSIFFHYLNDIYRYYLLNFDGYDIFIIKRILGILA